MDVLQASKPASGKERLPLSLSGLMVRSSPAAHLASSLFSLIYTLVLALPRSCSDARRRGWLRPCRLETIACRWTRLLCALPCVCSAHWRQSRARWPLPRLCNLCHPCLFHGCPRCTHKEIHARWRYFRYNLVCFPTSGNHGDLQGANDSPLYWPLAGIAALALVYHGKNLYDLRRSSADDG